MSAEDDNFVKDDKDAASKTRSLPLMYDFKVSSSLLFILELSQIHLLLEKHAQFIGVSYTLLFTIDNRTTTTGYAAPPMAFRRSYLLDLFATQNHWLANFRYHSRQSAAATKQSHQRAGKQAKGLLLAIM